MTARRRTWVINTVSKEPGEHHWLTVGLTTKEWIVESGDEACPGNTCTFVWVTITERQQLVQIGIRPHDHVTEDECLEQARLLLWVIRPFDPDDDPRRLLGREMPKALP